MEAEMEANMTSDERKKLERMRIEEADNALTDDLFGATDKIAGKGAAAETGDTIVLKTLQDHLKHARKVATGLKVR